MKGHWNAKAPLQIVVSYLCFLVTAGAGSLSYGGRTYDLEAGDCVFLDCRRGYAQSTSAHRDGSGSYDALWSLRWAHFDGPTMAGIYEKYQERGGQPVFSCAPHRQTRYEELLRSLLTLASSDSYVRDMEIAARLTELLTCLMEDAWKPEPERNGSAKRLSLTRVRSYIREMEARCRPRIAIPFSTGCAAPFQGRLFADRRGNLPMRYGRGETAA